MLGIELGALPLADALRRLGLEEAIIEPELIGVGEVIPDPEADPCRDALMGRIRLRWSLPEDLARAAAEAARLRNKGVSG